MPDAVLALSGTVSIFQLCQGLPDAWAAVEAGGTDAMLAAIETFAMTAPAGTLADAAAQLMVAYGRLSMATADELLVLRHALGAAILSAWLVVVRLAGIALEAMASRQYLPGYALEVAA